MSKNTHAERRLAPERAGKSVAEIAPTQWGNNPEILVQIWQKVLDELGESPETKRERIARQLVQEEIARLKKIARVN